LKELDSKISDMIKYVIFPFSVWAASFIIVYFCYQHNRIIGYLGLVWATISLLIVFAGMIKGKLLMRTTANWKTNRFFLGVSLLFFLVVMRVLFLLIMQSG